MTILYFLQSRWKTQQVTYFYSRPRIWPVGSSSFSQRRVSPPGNWEGYPQRLPVNLSHGHLVTRSCRHSVNSSQVNSSQARFFKKSSRHMVKLSHGHLVTSQHCTKLRVGAQNSVGMQILMVTTNVQNLGAPDP